MTYRVTRQADQDIVAIYSWSVRNFGQSQAERYYIDLCLAFDLIAANPLLSRERPEIDPPVRLYSCRSHLIVYRIDQDGVLILRVLHGRQDWERVL